MKTQDVTAVSSLELAFGRPVLADGPAGAATIQKLTNWLAGLRPQVHLAISTGKDYWDSNDAVGPLAIGVFAGLRNPVITDCWISADAALGTLTCGAEGDTIVGDTVEVTFTLTGGLGSHAETLSFTSADNGTEKRTPAIDLSAITNGGEWVALKVDVQRVAGSSADNQILELTAEEDEQTSSLPDPTND